MFNEKKYTKIDFYIEVLPLNVMYVGRKRLFDGDIQTIAVEAPQPTKPLPGKTSSRNFKSVPRKRRKGKTPTPDPWSDHLSPSTPTPKHVIPSPFTLELIHQYETAPEHRAEQYMPGDNVLTT